MVTLREDRRGVALVLVLWVVVVMGGITLAIVAASRSSLDVLTTVRARSTARYAAESGVVVAEARLRALMRQAGTVEEEARVFQRLEEDLRGMGEQGVGQGRFQVVVADLNARIDLNAAGEGVLRALFQDLFGQGHGSALLDALQDWKDADDAPRPEGAEAGEYLEEESPFLPRNGPLQRLDELSRIQGFTESVTTRLAPYVTIRSDGRVNINTAPGPVVSAAVGGGASLGRTLLGVREQRGTFGTLSDIRNALPGGSGPNLGSIGLLQTAPTRILVISRGWMEGHPLTHEIQAVLQLEPGPPGEEPILSLYHWMEKDR